MLGAERHAAILERLGANGRVLATELAAQFMVSPDTIRRDLRDLEEQGALRRVHGGALPPHGDRTPFVHRPPHAAIAKVTVARRAAALVRDGQVLILDGGTTNLEVARALRPALTATVITASPPTAVALSEHHGLEITIIGGQLRHDELVAVGSTTTEAFRGIRADIVMLGVCGLHPEIGVSCANVEEASVKRMMIDGASEVVALVDEDKLGTVMPVLVAPVDAITTLVTDADPADRRLLPYRNAGIQILGA